MSKSININGVDYLYYVVSGELFRLRASGLPAAGAVRSLVKSGSREFNRVYAALVA
jgi:hypothetical protein